MFLTLDLKMRFTRSAPLLPALFCLAIICNAQKPGYDTDQRGVWSAEKANEWYASKGWLRGCDFIPSTAINQLEMWQAASFDSSTIDRECLGCTHARRCGAEGLVP